MPQPLDTVKGFAVTFRQLFNKPITVQYPEYVNVIVLSALAVTLFFGGWEGPWAPLGPLWFFIKLAIAVSTFIWIRATLPRLRYDQLMRFGWKVLLPIATLNALVTALVIAAT